MISAKEANHKFAVETKLLTDKETINYIVKRNKTFGEKIVNGINRMIQRKIGSKEQKFLAGIRTKWESALEESRKEGDKKDLPKILLIPRRKRSGMLLGSPMRIL